MMLRFLLLLTLLTGSVCITLSQDDSPRLVINSRGHGGSVSAIHYTPDGRHLVTSSNDKVIRTWNLSTGEIEASFRHRQGDNFEGAVAPVALSPDGRYLTLSVGTYEQSEWMSDVRIIDRQTGTIVALLRGHQAAAMSATFSGDGKWLFTGDISGQIRVWNSDTFRGASGDTPRLVTDSVYLVGHETSVFAVRTNHDGSLLVSTDGAGQGFVWQRQANGFFQGLGDLGGGSGNVALATCSPNGNYIVAAGKDQLTYVFDGAGNAIGVLDQDAPGIKSCLEFSPNGDRIAIGVVRDANLGKCSVEVYDLPSGERTTTFREQPSGTSALSWHPNGTVIASAGGDNHDITIWDASPGGGDSLASLEGEGAGVWSVAIQRNPEEAPRIAFGSINDDKDDSHDTDLDNTLHRIFDFNTLRLEETRDASRFADFNRALWENGGRTLSYASPTELSVEGAILQFADASQGDTIRSFSFTPGGDIVVGTQAFLNLFRSNGQSLLSFNEQAGATYALAPSLDGEYLATAAIDQAVHLWNLRTGKRLASLFVSRDREWVCWTPSGHYEASAGGERYIGWHVNRPAEEFSDFYPSSVFRDQFHRPEIVRAVIAEAGLEAGLAAVEQGKRPAVMQSVATILPPTVDWVLPDSTRVEVSEGETFAVRGTVSSPGSPLREVRLLVNGKPVETFPDADGESFTLETSISLLPGENRLAVFARNEGSGATGEERIVVFRTSETGTPAPVSLPESTRPEWVEADLPPEMMPNLYMLTVGISEYENSDLTLSYCDDDARAIAEVFQNQKGRLFNQTHVRALIDGDATRDGILEGLEWLQSNATQKDIILLFLAAHGMNDGRNYYLVPYDADLDSLRRSGVAWADFADILGNLPAKTLMFLDTCHSGQLGENLYSFNTRSATRSVDDATEAIRELTSDENGVVVMAASTQGEQSVEHPDWGHGAFTLAVIEGLQGKADFIDDGIIQLRELDTYVAERVKELSGGIQHPTTVKPSSISRFPLIRIR